jgi:hypothetical protein
MVELDETCVWIAIFRVRLAAAFVTRMERGLSEVDAPCPMSSPPPPPPLIHFLSQNCTSDSASLADECRLASLHRRPHPISSSGTHCRVKWKLPTRAHRSLAIAAGPFARSISEGTVRRGKPRNEENDKRGVWERSAILPDDRRGAMKVINEIALLKSRPADTASSR